MRKGFRSSAHDFNGQFHLGVAAHVRNNTHCPHLSLVVPYKKKRCETSAGRRTAGRFRWLKSSVQLDGRVGGLLTSNLAPLLGYSSSPTAQSCALSWGRHACGVGWGRWPVTDGYQGAGYG